MRRGWFGVVVSCAAVLAAPALAKPPGMRLDYQRTPGVVSACPSEETFRQMVGIYTKGEELFKADAAYVLRVSLAQRGRNYHVAIAVINPDGVQRGKAEEHTFRTCPEAAREAASTAYLVLAPLTFPAPDKPPPAPPSTPPPAPSASSWAPPPVVFQNLQAVRLSPPPPEPPDNMEVTIGFSALVLMSVGLTDNVAPGLGLMADVRYDWFSLGLEFRGLFPGGALARTPISNDPDLKWRVVEQDISQLSAALVPCGRWKYLLMCGVAQAGALVRQTTVSTLVLPIVSFGPRLGFEVPIAERFAVFGFGEALVAAVRQGNEFTIDNDAPAANVYWDPSRVSGFFGVGLSATFK